MLNETTERLRKMIVKKYGAQLENVLNLLRKHFTEEKVLLINETAKHLRSQVIKNYGIHGVSKSLRFLTSNNIQIEEEVTKQTHNLDGKLIISDYEYFWGYVKDDVYRRLGGFNWVANEKDVGTFLAIPIYYS